MDIKQEIANMKGIPTQKELNENLQKGTYVVTFLKLDGDERVMPCTLQAKYFPDPKKESTQKNDKVVAVWALESKGFRSFRYDRLKAIKILKEE